MERAQQSLKGVGDVRDHAHARAHGSLRRGAVHGGDAPYACGVDRPGQRAGAVANGPVLLITGARRGRRDTWTWLDRFSAKRGPPAFVFVGCAEGVDEQARKWCAARGVTCFVGLACWDARGRAAGPERNAAMVVVVRKAFPDAVCLALPDARSVGTLDCRDRAKAAGLETHTLPMLEISSEAKTGA